MKNLITGMLVVLSSQAMSSTAPAVSSDLTGNFKYSKGDQQECAKSVKIEYLFGKDTFAYANRSNESELNDTEERNYFKFLFGDLGSENGYTELVNPRVAQGLINTIKVD